MATRVLPRRVSQTPHSVALRYLKTIGLATRRYVSKAAVIDKEIETCERRIEELKTLKQKAKPRISDLIWRFRAFAEKYRDDFLRGKTKSVATEVGRFGWANNPEGLIYQDDQKVIEELIRLRRFDLLRMEIRKKELSSEINNGQVHMATCRVGSRERFTVTPKGQPTITACGDDPVRIGKEELEA